MTTIYNQQTNYTLGATPLDIPIGDNVKSVWVNIASNTISGQVTGATVSVLMNGALPSVDIGYGLAKSFQIGPVSWVRIQGNGANVSFIISDSQTPVTSTTIVQLSTGGSSAPPGASATLAMNGVSGVTYAYGPGAEKRWVLWGVLVSIRVLSVTTSTNVTTVKVGFQTTQASDLQYAGAEWSIGSLTDSLSVVGYAYQSAFVPLNMTAMLPGSATGEVVEGTHIAAVFPFELSIEPTVNIYTEFDFSTTTGNGTVRIEVQPLGVQEPL